MKTFDGVLRPVPHSGRPSTAALQASLPAEIGREPGQGPVNVRRHSLEV